MANWLVHVHPHGYRDHEGGYADGVREAGRFTRLQAEAMKRARPDATTIRRQTRREADVARVAAFLDAVSGRELRIESRKTVSIPASVVWATAAVLVLPWLALGALWARIEWVLFW